MANATLRYQKVGAQGLRPFRSSGERRKKKEERRKKKEERRKKFLPYSPTPLLPYPLFKTETFRKSDW